MKDFVKTLLAVICGLFLFWIIGFILFFVMVGSVASVGGSGKTALPRNGVLDMNLAAFTLGEQNADAAPNLASFSFDMTPTVGLWNAVEAIKKAAADPSIKYILLRPEGSAAGISDMEELRAALVNFRKSGKAVVAYLENPGNGSYYLASVADKIYMTSYHGGMSQLVGVSGRMLFLKDLLDKAGVNFQLIRHGKYKSAGEMYIRSSSSAENREQNQVMVNSIWNAIAPVMAEARDIPVDNLNALVDDLKLNFPEDFLQYRLVDELVDHEALVNKLCTLAQVTKTEDLHLVPFSDYVSAKVLPYPGKTNVAVLYADGEIVDGSANSEVAGDRFVREIDKIRRDNSVKAVVLRVNSPGGSVLASAKIRAALDLLQAEKPVVASYGNYAASGGYWISNGCRKIYSDATTLTGSIGVFSMIPEFSGTAKKLGVGVETVGSNKHSDVLSLTRPFSAEETAYMQAYVEDIYEQFVNLVAQGRDMEPAQVDEIAQGRVWTGSDALEIGLVDEIGTLQDAIDEAASLSGLISEDDYKVVGFPKPLTFTEQMLQSLGQKTDEPSILAGTPFEGIGKALSGARANQPAQVWARLPYSIEIR